MRTLLLRGRLPRVAMAACAALALVACGGSRSPAAGPDAPTRPNILFVIMDDVGIDQMAMFGYGGATPPAMPAMSAVADAGIRFRNTWAMPECSPSRAALFTGRYPLRNDVRQAIGTQDLANSQLSPHEFTAPRLLKVAGYDSALFGKFHLAGPDHNQAGNGTPAELGWDYFYGWIGGVPAGVDATAGGLSSASAYSCGFVPGAAAGGTEHGACHYANDTCAPMRRSALLEDAPGLQCLASGGIFVPDRTCAAARPDSLDFTRQNGYYVSPLVIVEQGRTETVPLSDPRARGYRTRIEADAAIAWIKGRAASPTPWMATVSFTAAHTPVQQPPGELLPVAARMGADQLDCANVVHSRVLQNRMTEAMDTEFGRILIETGLATRDGDGSLRYTPAGSNTVIAIIGDNGSLGYSVKLPFDGTRSKGTAYQTGAWVPLIVAGPAVVQPGRDVGHMVNAVDLFQFFGELAGIDVHRAAPRTLDAVSMLPYLSDPAQPSLRTINFTQTGINIQAHGARNGACVVTAMSCSQIAFTKEICESNQGVWWGAGYTDPSVVPNGGAGYQSCAAVNQALHHAGRPMIGILAETSVAIRDERYKLVRSVSQRYDDATDTLGQVSVDEFYRIDEAVPVPKLDRQELDLAGKPLSDDAAQAHRTLLAKLEAILASEPACPGDGNRDGVVDALDLDNWSRISRTWGLSSVYDMLVDGVADGLTDHLDRAVIQRHLGTTCPASYAVY